MEFDWDEHNLHHIAQHGVTQTEAESALLGTTMHVDQRERNGEVRVSRIGRTTHGRILLLVTVQRGRKTRVVTGFDAPRQHRIRYTVRFGDKHDEARNA